jgi:hypothetical protein
MPNTDDPSSRAALTRILSHDHHPPHGLDVLNLPENTSSAPVTDEYITHNQQGFIFGEEEERGIPSVSHTSSSSPTLQGHGDGVNEKGLKVKLVVFGENDPEDPRNLSQSKKW